jgi:SAM-dependent methyltransferase
MLQSVVIGIQRLIKILRLRLHRRFGVLPLRYSLKFLSEWFASPLGSVLLEQEQALIDEQLHNLFGYHILQLSVASQLDLLGASRISHRFALYPQARSNVCISGLADFNHLPLAPNSTDVVLLHHVLDYSQRPHQILREAASVLISRGHLIIVGFNPWSLFGFSRWCAGLFSRSPQWRQQSLRLGRVLDWLEVLDFEPIHVQQGFYLTALPHPRAIKYLHWLDYWGKKLRLPWGGFYIIVARKDHLMLTPIKPEWQSYSKLRAWGVTRILGPAKRRSSDF